MSLQTPRSQTKVQEAENEFIERIARVVSEVIADELGAVYENISALANVVATLQAQNATLERRLRDNERSVYLGLQEQQRQHSQTLMEVLNNAPFQYDVNKLQERLLGR